MKWVWLAAVVAVAIALPFLIYPVLAVDILCWGLFALAFDLVYDDRSRDNDKLARNRSAILRALMEQLAVHELQLVRASDQPPAPLPF